MVTGAVVSIHTSPLWMSSTLGATALSTER